MVARRSEKSETNSSRVNKAPSIKKGTRRVVSSRSKPSVQKNRAHTAASATSASSEAVAATRTRPARAKQGRQETRAKKLMRPQRTAVQKSNGKDKQRRSSIGKSRKNQVANPQKSQQPSLLERYRTIVNTPLKRTVSNVILIIIAVFLCFGIFDTAMSLGRVHPGVSIAGVDVGGMTQAKAAERLNEELSPRLEQGAVLIYASDLAKKNYEANSGEDAASLNSASSYEGSSIMAVATNEEEPLESSWATLPSAMGASVDGTALAQKAYDVGREDGHFLPRLKAWFGGAKLAPELAFSDAALRNALGAINTAIGTPYTNADLTISQGKATVVPSSHGNLLAESDFKLDLAQAMLSDERYFIAEVKDTPPAVDDAQASSVAASLEQTIANPVELHYLYQTWSLDASLLGDCIATRVDMHDDSSGVLTPYVEYSKAKQVFSSFLGASVGTGAINAYFDVSSGTPVIVPEQTGLGPMLDKGANGLQTVLFGDSYRNEQREVTLLYGAVVPDITTDSLEGMGIIENVSTFSTHFNSSGSANRTYNIMLLANTVLNYNYIAPHSVWSFNETAGNCNEERGFKLSTAYVGGVHTQEAGGGICQVATTVFDAAYEAGLPIVERRSHSLYSENYRTIPDATVSYPDLDVKFENNTDHWMLMTMSADEVTTTVSLWGTSPGYTVTTDWGNWHEGESATSRVVYDSSYPSGYSEVVQGASDGWTVSITRHVTKDGVEVSTDTFDSYYGATDEVTVIGTG